MMLNTHKSKTDHETQPNYETCHAKETTEHCLLHRSKYEKEREVLFKTIIKIYHKNSQFSLTLKNKTLHNDHKSLREAYEKFINSTKKNF